jgi:hypothetical protein
MTARARTVPAALAALLLFAAACGGDGETCDPGCDHTFTLSLEKVSWSTGNWRIEVEAGELASTCEIRIPLWGSHPGTECDDPRVRVVRDGDGLSALVLEIPGFEDAPPRIEIGIAHEGDTITAASFTPSYQIVPGSNPDCDRDCSVASADLPL